MITARFQGPNEALLAPKMRSNNERVTFDRAFRLRTEQAADSQRPMITERASLDEFQNATLIEYLDLIEQQGFNLHPPSGLHWHINALQLAAPHCPRPEHVLQRL